MDQRKGRRRDGEALSEGVEEEVLDRIIRASINPGDLVLDPFCGCATTLGCGGPPGARVRRHRPVAPGCQAGQRSDHRRSRQRRRPRNRPALSRSTGLRSALISSQPGVPHLYASTDPCHSRLSRRTFLPRASTPPLSWPSPGRAKHGSNR